MIISKFFNKLNIFSKKISAIICKLKCTVFYLNYLYALKVPSLLKGKEKISSPCTNYILLSITCFFSKSSFDVLKLNIFLGYVFINFCILLTAFLFRSLKLVPFGKNLLIILFKFSLVPRCQLL